MLSIPYGKQHLNQADIDAVINVLHSDWLTQGKTIDQFEETVARYCGAKYAVALSSATGALHIACLAAGIQPGDLVWTTPNTFVASSNCALYCGANVDFVDIDSQTYNISPEALEKKLKRAKIRGQLPKLVIPVHFSGQPCDMVRIKELADQYGVAVIEDAAHAIGAEYKENRVGACEFSEMTIFSFHPVKIVTTGEGGMILTNRKDLYDKLIRLRSHGITREPSLLNDHSQGAWYYEQQDLGFHYRMTDIQAALGNSQMTRLPQFIKRRRELAKRYDNLLSELPLILPYQSSDGLSAYHLYVIQVDSNKTSVTRRQLFEQLRQAGIGVQVHYIPVYTNPYYQSLGFQPGYCPNVERYYARCVSLPMFFSLTNEQQDYVVSTLQKILAPVTAKAYAMA